MSCYSQFPTRLLGHGLAIAVTFENPADEQFSMLSDTIGCAYIITHAVYKGYQARESKCKDMLVAVLDTFLFDVLASAIIPFIMIKGVCILFNMVVSTTIPDEDSFIRRFGPPAVSIGLLCFTYEQIDAHVSKFLGKTTRKLCHHQHHNVWETPMTPNTTNTVKAQTD